MALCKLSIATRGLIGLLIVLSVLVPAVSAQDQPVLVVWVDEPLAAALEPAANRFERDAGVRVELQVLESREQARDRFREEASLSHAPDIIALSDDWIYDLIAHDLAPIDLGAKTGAFLPLTLRAFTHGDHLYGMPYNVVNLALVRNPDLVPDPPQTWDEVRELSVALRDSGRAEYGFMLNDYDAYHFMPIISAYGGYIIGANDDGSWNAHDVGLTTEGTLMAFEWLVSMRDADVLPMGYDWEAVHVAFEEGRAAMLISGPWVYWRFHDAGIPYVVDPLPAGTQPARPFVHMEGLQINAHSDKVELAQVFLVDYVATTEMMLRIADHVDGFSPHEEAFSLMTDPHELGWAIAARDGQLFPGPVMDPLWDPLAGAIQAVWAGQRTPEQALNETVEQYFQQIE